MHFKIVYQNAPDKADMQFQVKKIRNAPSLYLSPVQRGKSYVLMTWH